MATIAVIGSTMMDMIAYVDRFPESGETLIGRKFALGFGGKGANQAVAAARFGATVTMINAVGDDDFGAMHIANFKEHNVNTDHILVKTGSSGVAPIWVDETGMNRIVIVPGANDLLTVSEAVAAADQLKDLDAVIGQFEIPQEVTAAVFKRTKERGATTFLNPAPAASISPELLAVTDWLIPNEVEFAALHPQNAHPWEDGAILEFAEHFGTRVCVTLGGEGAALATSDGKVLRISAPVVSATDTTGAGDCFVGAFVHAMSQALGEEKSVALACAGASLSVQRPGTQTSFPSTEEAAQMWMQINEH